MPLAEIIRPIEIKGKEGRQASVEAALNYLNQMTEEIESGKRDRVVLAANLLQEGQRYPSLSGRFVKGIKTDTGFLSVSEQTWLNALDVYIEKLGVPAGFILERPEKDTVIETSTLIFQTKPNLFFRRVSEYDFETGERTSLRLEILYRSSTD